MIATPPRLLLLDFDGVLARYSRPLRVAYLAEHCQVAPAQVAEAVFGSGLETAYDGGDVDTATYLARLRQALGKRFDRDLWLQARTAACRAEPLVVERVRDVARHTCIGILTNNGPLMAEAIPRIVPLLAPLLKGNILCSGMLGGRKPQREVFMRALAHFGAKPAEVLFVDDVFANVRGARAAGLHADTVNGARSMRRVLQRYRLI